MIEVRPFGTLGGGNHGWLDTRHHFSFADYQDPGRLNWGRIRVWNDDEIAPASGFPLHPHSDMEIITYVREGAITHKDSLGNAGRTEAGDVQVMSAGSGIRHAEWNAEPGHDEDLPDLDRAGCARRSAFVGCTGRFHAMRGRGRFVALAAGRGRKGTRCRYGRMRRCSAPRSAPARRRTMRWARAGMAIWWRRRGGWR